MAEFLYVTPRPATILPGDNIPVRAPDNQFEYRYLVPGTYKAGEAIPTTPAPWERAFDDVIDESVQKFLEPFKGWRAAAKIAENLLLNSIHRQFARLSGADDEQQYYG